MSELLCGFVNVVTYLTFDFSAGHLCLLLFIIAQGSFLGFFRIVDILVPEYRVLQAR